MEINKVWAMSNKNTFSISPIKELISKYIHGDKVSIDPFANESQIAKITNDLNPAFNTTHNLDALDFLKIFNPQSIDVVLFDPPYSPRQVAESYKKMDKVVNMQTTQSSFWSNLKKEMARIIKPQGIVISFAWNSGGIGKRHGFAPVEILLVSHGGWHNDTIVTVEKKINLVGEGVPLP